MISKIAILRLPDVIKLIGRPRSSIYALIKDGLFPRQIKIGKRAVGWPSSETEQIIKATVRGANVDEMRQLVAELEAQRNL